MSNYQGGFAPPPGRYGPVNMAVSYIYSSNSSICKCICKCLYIYIYIYIYIHIHIHELVVRARQLPSVTQFVRALHRNRGAAGSIPARDLQEADKGTAVFQCSTTFLTQCSDDSCISLRSCVRGAYERRRSREGGIEMEVMK